MSALIRLWRAMSVARVGRSGSGCLLAATQSIVLENLSHTFAKPNILDVKLGTVLYDDGASAEKRAAVSSNSALWCTRYVFRSFSTAPISATLRSTRGGGRATGRAVLYAGRMCSFFR